MTDYWTSVDDTTCNSTDGRKHGLSITDLWMNDGPAKGHNNSWECSQNNEAPGCVYEDELFGQQVLDVIAAHDPATPFFLFWSPHIVHEPLEVPASKLAEFNFIKNDTPNQARQYYSAMVRRWRCVAEAGVAG